MAQRPARPCLDCGKLTRNGSRCEAHAQIKQQQRERARGTKVQRGYGPGWSRLSAATIKAQPYCSICLTEGSAANPLTADHILAVRDGGTSTTGNLRTLCRRCNSAKGSG